MVQSVSKHLDVVTCIALTSDCGQHWLVSGSKDCTVIVWDVVPDRDPVLTPRATLYGHDGAVRSVAANAGQSFTYFRKTQPIVLSWY